MFLLARFLAAPALSHPSEYAVLLARDTFGRREAALLKFEQGSEVVDAHRHG